MVIASEIWIQLHVIKEIMHPSHVPLHGKSQSAVFRSSGHLWPCCRFLCNNHSSVISSSHYRIQMFEEFDRFQILILPIDIRHPVACAAAIIQIQHRCHCIHTQSVNMELFYPVQGIGNQEILYFVLSIIKYLGSPIWMLALSRICIFIQRLSVKICQTCSILREMCRYPVQNYSNSIFMEVIHHILKIFRCAISGRWCIVANHLITPGTIKWMLCNAHQFYVRIPHILYILCQFMGEFTIIVKSIRILFCRRMLSPGTRMHFVNCHRDFIHILFLSGLQPSGICPLQTRDIRHPGSSSRTELCLIAIWICLIQLSSITGSNQELIKFSHTDSFYKDLIDTDLTDTGHLISFPFFPFIKITYYVYLGSMRCPYGKINTFFAFIGRQVRPQLFIYIIMCALPKEILIQFSNSHFF